MEKKPLLLEALAGKPVPAVPTWVMRQAGRYLPEFRATRAQTSFFKLCATPELACRVTLQPLERYESLLDGAIIFSDILVVPQALGQTVEMVEGRGPVFRDPLKSPDDLARLRENVDIDRDLGYVLDAIRTTRAALGGRIPLFGFAGAPWTVAAYMIEGGGSKTLSRAKSWLFAHAEASHALLRRVTDVTVAYLRRQADAGAQQLQVFDSWAGELAPHHFAEFSLPYLAEIARALKASHPDIPLVVFARNATHHALEPLARDTLYDAISIDFGVDMAWAHSVAFKRYGKVVQGNMDPSCLFGTRALVRREVARMLRPAYDPASGSFSGLVANLGHGMYPTHTPEMLHVFLEAVKACSRDPEGFFSDAGL